MKSNSVTINPKKSIPVGAALVIGGGIAGIQASLDLANSGFKVYLVESSPAIGGNMARLDKTFPTNDCSMCILSPKIVECGRHLNIETITWAELEEFREEKGRFRATIRKRARFVDASKCTGCGECFEACPITVASEFDTEIGSRKVIFRPYPQAFPNVPVIDKQGKSPCRLGCPAGININAYVALTAARRFDEALDVILENVPFAGALGRVCDHPCESKCHMASFGEPVAICALKRFLSDRRRARGKDTASFKKKEQNLAKVAVIGSGPAGLTAARELARKGYRPTVFEALSRAGGMLAWGIPDYRLPPEILDEEIKDILREGMDLVLNSPFGTQITLEGLKKKGFEAVILAIGAQAGTQLGVEGEEGKGVIDSIAFLHQVKTERKPAVGRKVTVIGGGNSAIDAARTALRLGADEVVIVYRRTRTEMPAISFEVEAAEAEGIQIHYLAAPVRMVRRDDNISAMECIRMQLGEPDASGRRKPEPIPGSEFIIETDMVISAIGQKVVLPEDRGLKGLKVTRWGTIKVGEGDATTGINGVFAIGDAVSGPRNVVEAIAEGRKAAAVVDACLRKIPFVPLPRVAADEISQDLPRPDARRSAIRRQKQSELPLSERRKSFAEVESGLTEEQAVAEANRCLHCAVCSECMACLRVCKAEAILHDQQDIIEKIDVGAVLVVPGFAEYHPRLNYDYGYSRYADVVSSIQFERILSASGPFAGHVQRPSDRKEPKKIAFLQCVGSRDVLCRNGYCSSVCCMYAIKEAIIAKEHMKNVEVTVFFMDIRAFGKDFDKYYERAKAEYGVRFVRARVSDVSRRDSATALEVQYAAESGGVSREDFDLVVLSVGLEPAPELDVLAGKLGIRLDAYGFVWTDPVNPLRTSRPGIFAGGVASGPKDIPETVAQASGAACEAGRLLRAARGTLTVERKFPPERDVTGEPVRVGVFVCHCGINIGGIVNVPKVRDYAATLPGVVFVADNLYTCSQDTQKLIVEHIREHNLNRIVVASCSPRTHESLFQETLREAGLNPHLFAMVNIRDQCSWVHQREPEAATEKAKDLVHMAVAKACLAEPLAPVILPVTHQALVIGGGLAGMTGALAIADHGFEVCLVEKEKELGGHLRDLQTMLGGQDLQALLASTMERVRRHPLIRVHFNATVREINGFVGNYESILSDGAKFKHGAILVTTGASEYRPTEYGYGQNAMVVTQTEFSDLLIKGVVQQPENIVMIQCVGSREEPRQYCSRVCCSKAIQNAIRVKELFPAANVYVLYRDIRTYGYRELYYAEARDKGVLFIRFDLDHRPEVVFDGSSAGTHPVNSNLNVVAGGADPGPASARPATACPEQGRRVLSCRRPDSTPTVIIRDTVLGQQLRIKADYVVLSTGIVADHEANDALAKQLKVPINQDGFFMEAHVKLRPVEFATDGVYVAGLAHSPKAVEESMTQALAAASRACVLLAQKELDAHGTVSNVNLERCMACGLCEKVCAFSAIGMELQRIGKQERLLPKVNLVLCKGCGACAASCRCGAIILRGCTEEQVMAEIMAL